MYVNTVIKKRKKLLEFKISINKFGRKCTTSEIERIATILYIPKIVMPKLAIAAKLETNKNILTGNEGLFCCTSLDCFNFNIYKPLFSN